MDLEVLLTSDGSTTVLNKEINATYHSKHGAIQESKHIYINSGLNYAQSIFGNELSVLEIGFGTGLNAFLTLLEAKSKNLHIKYDAIEKFPIPNTIYNKLNYPNLIKADENQSYKAILECEWERYININSHFYISKFNADINNFNFSKNYHVVYYDAFAPDSSPESWSSTIFEKLYYSLPTNANIVTFCAKGNIKRTLKNIGFVVESLTGPPGKREITRAIKP